MQSQFNKFVSIWNVVEYPKNNSKTVIVEQIFESNRFFNYVCLTWIFYFKISQAFSLDTVLGI